MKVQSTVSNLKAQNMKGASDVIERLHNESTFKMSLDNVEQEQDIHYFEDKLEEITKQGELLCEKADIAQLNKYKGLIQDLVKYTVNKSFKFTKSNTFDSRGRSKVFALINEVDSRLNNMTKQILEEERENIDLVASVNDIRGLLVDIFL